MAEVAIIQYSTYAALGETHHISIEIENKKNSVLAESQLSITENSYYYYSCCKVPSILPYSSKKVILVAKVKGAVTPADIPTLNTFKLTIGNSTIASGSYIPNIHFYAKPTLENIDMKLNILVFGLIGSGKSSLINTFFTLLNDECDIVKKAEELQDNEHVTKELVMYELTKQIKLRDIWGITNTNYGTDIVEKVLHGELPSGWSMGFELANHKQNIESAANKAKAASRAIHSVIFVVPASMSNLEEDFKYALKEKFKYVSKFCPNPIVVLSMVDHLCPIARTHPEKAFLDETIRNRRVELCNLLGCSLGNVHIGVNYTQERQKNTAIDVNTFKILYHAVMTAKNNYSTVTAKVDVQVNKKPELDWSGD